MAFAIFYNLADLSSIAGSSQSLSLSNALRQRIKPYWDGGLSGWATAPQGQSPNDAFDPDSRIVVVNPGNKGNLADFRQLLRDIAAFLGGASGPAQYLIALAADMEGVSGAIEPWPPA